MFCSRCWARNPEQSAFCYNCGQKIASPPNRGMVTEDKNAPMRETKPWPRGAEEDAPTSLDLQPAVDRINAKRGPKLLDASVKESQKRRDSE